MFDILERERVGELHVIHDPASQLRAIIAIHSTQLGPALGGCRFIEYPDERAAALDAVRLARGMTYKAALAGIDHGGGKAVILKPRDLRDRDALFERFGAFIDTLGGRYITSLDSGTTARDMDAIARATGSVVGTTAQRCDPAPCTALGVFEGIRAAVATRLRRADLHGLRVAIQGLGHVGMDLARRLRQTGATLIVSDLNDRQVQWARAAFDARAVAPAAIARQSCEVFAPCALGGVLTPTSVPELRCAIVAGCANNQLLDADSGRLLHQRRILYAPDFVINAGGLIKVALAHAHHSEGEILQRSRAIGQRLARLFDQAERLGEPPEQLARRLAEETLQMGGDREDTRRAV